MSFLSEFKEFAMKGNVVDLAVGVIIGGAFGKIVSYLVEDVIMPIFGVAVGGVNFTDLAITLQAAHGDTPAVVLKYGVFLQSVFNFLIIAFSIFVVIKLMNKMKRKEEALPDPVVPPTKEEVLLTEIRDILRTK